VRPLATRASGAIVVGVKDARLASIDALPEFGGLAFVFSVGISAVLWRER
jgi:hypothetical protein